MTIKDSNWLLTLMVPPQPHFINQPKGVTVVWGYGLSPDKTGNYVNKKMSECTGEEIMIEVCSHLGFAKKISKILALFSPSSLNVGVETATHDAAPMHALLMTFTLYFPINTSLSPSPPAVVGGV